MVVLVRVIAMILGMRLNYLRLVLGCHLCMDMYATFQQILLIPFAYFQCQLFIYVYDFVQIMYKYELKSVSSYKLCCLSMIDEPVVDCRVGD